MKGDTQERRLMASLRELGFIPMRSPGSGTGDWEQPDVLAAQQGIPAAIELKAGACPSNLREDEVDALFRFADAFWAAALVAVRYKRNRTFFLTTPSRLDRTDSGRYSINASPDILDWAVSIPYKVGSDGVEVGDLRFRVDAPSLADWFDAVTARQQGVMTRRGVMDLAGDEARQRAADGPDGDADMDAQDEGGADD